MCRNAEGSELEEFHHVVREKGFFREELVFKSNWQQDLVLIIQYFRTEQKDNHH